MHYVTIKDASIPKLGFGTYKLNGATAQEMTERALDLGFRHIDTAQAYNNESEVGRGIDNSDVDRDNIWITTKIWWEQLGSLDSVHRSVEGSLQRLGVDQVDLLLIHWPHPDLPLEQYYPYLLEMHDRGYTRHVGVSNFTPELIHRAAAIDNRLINNQVEYHPLLDQSELLAACRQHDISLTAYSPLAQGELIDHPLLTEIGNNHSRTAAQIALRWLLQQDKVLAIPKTSNPDRLEENFKVFDFDLQEDEMERLNELSRQRKRVVDPEFAPNW